MTRPRRPRVAVIGAGIAGLAAALRLRRAGCDVIVLERQARVGGRALTLRDGLTPPLGVNAGPARFPPDCRRVIAFAQAFGLATTPFYPDSGAFVAMLEGRRIRDYRPTADDFWGFHAAPVTTRARLSAAVSRTMRTLRQVSQPADPRRPAATFQFVGGTERLAAALAEAFGAGIACGVRVTGVRQGPAGVIIDGESAAGGQHWDADFALCATPLSALPGIVFEPALDDERLRLARDIPFHAAVRVVFEMREPFWRAGGFNGFAVTDTVGEVWDPHFASDSRPAILVCYAKDALATRLHQLDHTARPAVVLDALDRVFPGAREHCTRAVSFSWSGLDWVSGGWPAIPEQLKPRMRLFRSPAGRVYFAGDHATPARWMHTVEGALESAEHAVGRLLRAR